MDLYLYTFRIPPCDDVTRSLVSNLLFYRVLILQLFETVYDTTQILSESGNGSVVAGYTMDIIIFMRRSRYS